METRQERGTPSIAAPWPPGAVPSWTANARSGLIEPEAQRLLRRKLHPPFVHALLIKTAAAVGRG